MSSCSEVSIHRDMYCGDKLDQRNDKLIIHQQSNNTAYLHECRAVESRPSLSTQHICSEIASTFVPVNLCTLFI